MCSSPRFKPAMTTKLSDKIHTHLTTALCHVIKEDHFMVLNVYKWWWSPLKRLPWSCYASWSLFCCRFVDIQQSFSCIFHIKDGNDFNQFSQTEENETQGYYIHYFTCYANANQLARDYHSIVCHHLSLRNCTSSPELHKCGGFKIIFQDLIRWTEMFARLLVT